MANSKSKNVQRFILMPPRGLVADSSGPQSHVSSLLVSLHVPLLGGEPAKESAGTPGVRVVDSIHENGLKLVEMGAEAMQRLRTSSPGLRIVPIALYKTMAAPRPTVSSAPKSTSGASSPKVRVRVTSRNDGAPIRGAHVVAFTNFDDREGAEATTNAQGLATLALKPRKVERLYVFPRLGFWVHLSRNVQLASSHAVSLVRIVHGVDDSVRHFHGKPKPDVGRGVTVGIVDTGCGPHADLAVAGGENTVPGEPPTDFHDNGAWHGTHVAGIVASRGAPPAGTLGVAPGVTLRAYRVFGKGSETATNYAIAKAVDRAVADGCDLVNMSLGGGPADPATSAAIADARSRGVVVVCAAGNDYRDPVSYPGADARALAVSAFGRKGTFPRDSTETADVATPYGKDKKNFLAAFTNVGLEIDLTGPGVGVVSTVPGGYAVMGGTSMACPAVTGMMARVMASNPQLLAMSRDQVRSDAMIKAAFGAARKLGFGPANEGIGLLR